MTGCSLQPIFHRPDAPVAATFPSGEAYKYPATGEGGTMLPATEIGWRDFMADPRLQRSSRSRFTTIATCASPR